MAFLGSVRSSTGSLKWAVKIGSDVANQRWLWGLAAWPLIISVLGRNTESGRTSFERVKVDIGQVAGNGAQPQTDIRAVGKIMRREAPGWVIPAFVDCLLRLSEHRNGRPALRNVLRGRMLRRGNIKRHQ